MSLADLLNGRGGPQIASFQLMGEHLAAIGGHDLRQAAAEYDAGLERLSPDVRAAFEREQAALLTESCEWLARYNRSLHSRIAGYQALAKEVELHYPWPVVAVLGICQVQAGLRRNGFYRLWGSVLSRAGSRLLERFVDGAEDVLLRTNRGIFADSVPTVLWGLRAHRLRSSGEGALAEALLSGPLPPIFDEESRAIARGLSEGLAVSDAQLRFSRLAVLTRRHFAREQAIFTHHIGRISRREPELVRTLITQRSVSAPRVERGRKGRRLVFRAFALPPGFDLRAHAPRVEVFQRAFVDSVIGDPEDYRVAAAYAQSRR
jgi:hypothetical protein